MAEIVFLNHSSVLVQSPQTAILCDPWYTGTAFNNGWRLLAEESHEIEAIPATHIWISHEHPDHFSPLTLARLASGAQFLYQRTAERKVHDYLTARGHAVRELDDAERVCIGDLHLTTFFCDGYDSAALFEFDDGSTFLNVNDARIELGGVLERIQTRIKAPPDSMAIQFSYANWAGNEGDTEIPRHQQDLVLERVLHIARTLQPRTVLLFASFVYYSHEENFYWNRGGNLNYVVDTLERHGIRAIVPTPNQRFDVRDMTPTSNAEAIAYWDALARSKAPVDRTSPVTLDALRHAYATFFQRLWNENAIDAARTPRNCSFQLRVRLSDLNQTLTLGLFEERFDLALEPETDTPDCTVSSETLLFLFKNKFGRGTVTVNGRIQFNYETAHRFFVFFFISYGNNIGRYYRERRLTADLLSSIRHTSVMTSILKFHPAAVRRFDEDLARFAASPARAVPEVKHGARLPAVAKITAIARGETARR